MAYATSNRTANLDAGGFAGMVATVREGLRKRRVYAETLRELRGLSDRDLADLDMHRSMIVEVAREAAYGK